MFLTLDPVQKKQKNIWNTFENNRCQENQCHPVRGDNKSLTHSLSRQLSSRVANSVSLIFVLMKKTQDAAEHFIHNAAIETERTQEAWEWFVAAWTLAQKMPPDDLSENIFSLFSQGCLLINIWVFCSCRTGSTKRNPRCVYDATHVESAKKKNIRGQLRAHLLKRINWSHFLQFYSLSF